METETIKIILASAFAVLVALGLSSCGMSVGSSAFGTSGFMEQHNRKLEIVRASDTAPLEQYTEGERENLNRYIARVK